MIKFNIKLLRTLNINITQNALSEKTGIRLATLTAYEHNTAKTISVKHLDALCKAFNCTLTDLITFIPDEETDGNECQTFQEDIIQELAARIKNLEKRLNEHIANHWK